MINTDTAAMARRAQRLVTEAGAAVSNLVTALSTDLKAPVKEDVNAEHRRAHRKVRPAKIAADSELHSFIVARLDTLTFDQIAKEVAAQFPPNRRISRSSIHRWWLKSQRA